MSAYLAFKYLHVLSAIVWIGAGVYGLFLLSRLLAAGDEVAVAFLEAEEAAGNRVFAPAAMSTLLFGVLMVLSDDALGFGTTFVVIGFIGILASLVIGAVLYSKASAALTQVLRTHGRAAPEVATLRRRVQLLGLLDLGTLGVVVWAMVYKPG